MRITAVAAFAFVAGASTQAIYKLIIRAWLRRALGIAGKETRARA